MQESHAALLLSDPSQMSFKAIQAMFINDKAQAVTNQIDQQNEDMVHKTKDFERELRKLEISQMQAKMEETALKQQVKAAKYRSRQNFIATVDVTSIDNQAEDFLAVIATP